MHLLGHRSAIACKLGTAIVLLLHSVYGCTGAHGCCSNHWQASTAGSQAHPTCQHARVPAQREAPNKHPGCGHQHDDHQSRRVDRVEHGSCGDHATPPVVDALAKQNAQRLPEKPEKMQPCGVSHSMASPIGNDEFSSLSAVFIQGRFQKTRQATPFTTAPLREPCSDHSDPCCSTLHCSFLTVTAETLSIDLGSLFPQPQMAFAVSGQRGLSTVLTSPPSESMCVDTPQPRCAFLCVWQV